MSNNLMLNAIQVLGCRRAKFELRLMVKALSLHSWLNDQDDRMRLTAARHALAHWPEYVATSQAKIDARRLTHAEA